MRCALAVLLSCIVAVLGVVGSASATSDATTRYATASVYVGAARVGTSSITTQKSGRGDLSFQVNGLTAGKAETISIYHGTCAHLGARIARYGAFVPPGTDVNMMYEFSASGLKPLTDALRAGAVSIVIGTLRRCGTYSTMASCSVSAAHPVAPWKILVVVYPNAAFSYTDSAGVVRTFHSTMSDADIASIRDAAGAMPDTVAAWSHGYTSVAATVAISTHTLDKVDPYGSGSVWLSPDDARADLSALAPLGQYDAVFVAWDNQADQGDNLLLPYGGLGGLYDPITGAYFASGLLPGAGWPSWWFPTLLIHEWLHGVTDYYALWGYKGPSPDDGDRDGYTVGSDMHDFYSDLMTGTVHLADGTPLGGITQALWQSGSPTSRPVACSR